MASPRLFLSHSSQDVAWCNDFVEALKQQGYDVWYDQNGLYVGTQWIRTIEQELQTRDYFIIILSPAAWQSEWVREELSLALSQRKAIIGIMQQSVLLDGFITSRQILNVIGQTGQEAAKSLLAALRSATEAENQSTTPTSDEPTAGQLIKMYRHAKQITQPQLAGMTGVSLMVIAIIERGGKVNSPNVLKYIGEAMHLTDEEIQQILDAYAREQGNAAN